MKLQMFLLVPVALIAACSSSGSVRATVQETTPTSTIVQTTSSPTVGPSSTTPSSSTIAKRSRANVVEPKAGPLAIVQAGTDLVGVQPGNPVLWSLPGAVTALDGSAVASAVVGEGRTTAVVNDTRSAASIGTWTIDGELAVSVVAPKGRFVALVGYVPGQTRLVVIDASSGKITDRMLKGHVRPEAFRVDGTALFALDDRPAVNPTYYRVQSIDVATGDRYDVNDRDKAELPEDMTGSSVRAVATSDGTMLATLYRNPGKTPAAFVHVLNLSLGYTYCADLPAPFGSGAAGTDSIALSPDGASVFVSSAGAFATIGIDALRD
jgi:Mrp family chromosome partitioning ATPase